jgi:3-isopropylmalate/(R)-2-methylmalate dehydratase small subunit
MSLARVHLVGSDINTDYIIASRHKAKANDAEGLARYVFEDLDPTLAGRIAVGDVIVAGTNFGSGSSRETAPRVLKAAGIRAVIARSFARIFFRNAINVGLTVIESEWSGIEDGDRIDIDEAAGQLVHEEGRVCGSFAPLPPFLLDILRAGGVRGYLQERRGSGEG